MDRAGGEGWRQVMATVSKGVKLEGIQITLRHDENRLERKSAESVFRPLTRPTAQNSEEKPCDD